MCSNSPEDTQYVEQGTIIGFVPIPPKSHLGKKDFIDIYETVHEIPFPAPPTPPHTNKSIMSGYLRTPGNVSHAV